MTDDKPTLDCTARGWICPVCNRGVAPREKACEHGGALGMQVYLTTPPLNGSTGQPHRGVMGPL